jgi:hypothetical protein
MTPTLRPMSLGEILDRTFQIYRSRFLLFVTVGALPALAMRSIYLADGAWIHVRGLVHPARSSIVLWNLVVSLGFYHISFFLGLLIQPAYVKLASSSVFSERCSIASSLRFAAARWSTYLWAAFLKLLGAMIGSELLVGGLTIGALFPLNAAGEMDGTGSLAIGLTVAVAVVSCFCLFLWLSACFAFAIPSAAFEGLTAFKAMRRSWTLTRGCRGRIAFTWLMVFAISWIVGGGIQLLLRWIAYLVSNAAHHAVVVRGAYPPVSYTIATAFTAILGPIFPIALTLFYYDQRIRREGYDIEQMMEAAGLNPTETQLVAEEPLAPSAAQGDHA